MENKKITAKFKLWLSDADGNYLIGSGGYKLLAAIEKYNNLSDASDELNISYRKAWNILNKIKENCDESPVITHRGGTGGGGGMELSKTGHFLLEKIDSLTFKVSKLINEEI